jgi:hypothetical protein
MGSSAQQWHRADRRHFIGGSDAASSWATMNRPSSGSGGRSAARSSRKTSQTISSCSSTSQARAPHVTFLITEPNRTVASGVLPILPGFPLLGFAALLARTLL